MKYIIFIVLAIPFFSFAQDGTEFTRDQEFYIRGNTAVIGNNILSKSSKKPFNKLKKVNDEFKMKYVDIDQDPNTWSSSSAYLELKEDVKVLYAGLYWSGTYKGDRSVKRQKDHRVYHKVAEERSHNVREVQIKFADSAYQEVRGTVIYDGVDASSKSVRSRAPYACVADVTSFFKNNSTTQFKGQITVANVSASEGEILGGSSAGWLLYVVYEDMAEPYHYITTFHGFEFVNKKPVLVNFGNFQSSKSGEVETAVTIAALEGDSSLSRDQVGIFDPEEDLYVTLGNDVRASNNFFNSTITIGDEVFNNRVPNSENTLGFDLAKISIPAAQNDIIANNIGGVKMQFKTRSDRYFLFFTAFQTSITEGFYNEKNNDTSVTKIKTSPVTTAREIPIVKQEVKIAVPPVSTPTTVYKPKDVVNPKLAEVINKPSLIMDNVAGGYYIVTNVFSDFKNAETWKNELIARDMDAQLFMRPDNAWFYVFIDARLDAREIYKRLSEIKKLEGLENSWVLKLNLD